MLSIRPLRQIRPLKDLQDDQTDQNRRKTETEKKNDRKKAEIETSFGRFRSPSSPRSLGTTG
jgi:hypothetical protein